MNRVEKLIPISAINPIYQMMSAVILTLFLSCFTSCSEAEDVSLLTDMTGQETTIMPGGDNPDNTGGNDTDNGGTTATGCDDVTDVDSDRGTCTETLSLNGRVTITQSGSSIVVSTNSIPDHRVGLFGSGSGSLNPNAISAQNETYTITADPSISGQPTPLLSTS